MQTLSPDLQARAAQIRPLILGVDDVLTDGRIFIHDSGEETKSFNALDGHRLRVPQAGGVQTVVITGRSAPSVGACIRQLGIRYYFEGISDRHAAYAELRKQADAEEHKCAYAGDDVVDLPAMVRYGLPVTVSDARWFMLQYAICATRRRGGRGAVCEVCDLIMRAKGTPGVALSEYVR